MVKLFDLKIGSKQGVVAMGTESYYSTCAKSGLFQAQFRFTQQDHRRSYAFRTHQSHIPQRMEDPTNGMVKDAIRFWNGHLMSWARRLIS
ncbi:hypothetical protein TNCV_2394121 [Trichonephila clavipes]|nr:hypothetical protein TNCV_2394121 [Trichonephila clavipes]